MDNNQNKSYNPVEGGNQGSTANQIGGNTPQSMYGSYGNQNQYNGNLSGMEKPMSVGDWILSMLLLCIPVVNIVLLFMWSFTNDVNPSSLVTGANTTKKNWAKVSLILMGISVILAILGACSVAALLGSASRYY